MKKLFNDSPFDKRLPSGLFFAAGQGRVIGDKPDQVPATEASRLKRFPGWAEREVEDCSSAPGSSGAGSGGNASKGALKAAEEAGLDLATVAIAGTGKDGQITKGDVDAFIAARDASGGAGK